MNILAFFALTLVDMFESCFRCGVHFTIINRLVIAYPFFFHKPQGPESPTAPVVDTIEAEKSTSVASVSSSDQTKEQ